MIAYPTFNTATLKHTHVREDASPGHIPESRPVWAQLQLTLLSKIHRVLITIGSLYVHVHAYISRSYTHAGPNNAQVRQEAMPNYEQGRLQLVIAAIHCNAYWRHKGSPYS